MNVTMRREKVVHHHEMNLPAVRNFHSVQSIKLRNEGVWVFFDVCIIVPEYLSEATCAQPDV